MKKIEQVQNIIEECWNKKETMKTIDDVLYALENADGECVKREILRYWVNEIIDECANNWECTMEGRDVEQDFASYIDVNGDQVYPVLVRGSVTQIKNKL